MIANSIDTFPEEILVMRDDTVVRKSSEDKLEDFEELVKRYESKVYTLAYRLIGDEEDVEEVLDETFFKAYDSFSLSRDKLTSFAIFLYQITIELCFEKLRQRKNAPFFIPLDTFVEIEEDNEEIIDWSNNLKTIPNNKELILFMEKAIEDLPDDLKIVFILKDMEGFSNKEISEILYKPIETIKSQIHLARRYLRQRLNSFLP